MHRDYVLLRAETESILSLCTLKHHSVSLVHTSVVLSVSGDVLEVFWK